MVEVGRQFEHGSEVEFGDGFVSFPIHSFLSLLPLHFTMDDTHSIKIILSISPNGYHSLDITQWISLNGYHSMDITQWISLNGYHSMDITQWISLNGYHSMDVTQSITFLPFI
jgi:hypothetical protein